MKTEGEKEQAKFVQYSNLLSIKWALKSSEYWSFHINGLQSMEIKNVNFWLSAG